MDYPKATPIWVERFFNSIEDSVESGLVTAETAEQSLKASGAFALWKDIKNEIELQVRKEQLDVRQRNERLNARESVA